MNIVAVPTDLSGKERHTQVGLDRVIASESLGNVMVSTQRGAWTGRHR